VACARRPSLLLPRGGCVAPGPSARGARHEKQEAALAKQGKAPQEPHRQSPGRLRIPVPVARAAPLPLPPPPPPPWPPFPKSARATPPPPAARPSRRPRTSRSRSSKRSWRLRGGEPLAPAAVWPPPSRPPPGILCAEWCALRRSDAAATRTSTRAAARCLRWRRCHARSVALCAVAAGSRARCWRAHRPKRCRDGGSHP
jgi:hypothetical protein